MTQKATTKRKTGVKAKTVNKQAKKLEKDQEKSKDDDDAFTLNEVRDIHSKQQDDPFYNIQNIRNRVKLENLNLSDRF